MHNEVIIQYGYSGLFFIQILAFWLSFFISFSIKKSNPENLQIIIYLIICIAAAGNYFYTKDVQQKFNIHVDKQKAKSKKLNSFKQFKQGKELIHKEQLREILNNSSTGLHWMLSNLTSDSLILLNPSGNLKYAHYIEAGSKFKMENISGARERIAEDAVYFSIDHEDYIRNNKYKHKSRINVRDAGYFAFWEIDPKDIRYEVSKIGIDMMENRIDAFNENRILEYFFDIESSARFFPNSDLIKKISINKKESKNHVVIDTLEIFDKHKYIKGDNINLRSSPEIKDNIIGKLNEGVYVKILARLRVEDKKSTKAILKEEITVDYKSNRFVLRSGKVISIIKILDDKIICDIELDDNITIKDTLNKDKVEKLNVEVWLKIKHFDKIGYISERFIASQNNIEDSFRNNHQNYETNKKTLVTEHTDNEIISTSQDLSDFKTQKDTTTILLDSINRMEAKLLTKLSRKEKRRLKKQLKKTKKEYEEYKK